MTNQDKIGEDNLGGVTRKMTTADKVSLIVQAGIDGGYFDNMPKVEGKPILSAEEIKRLKITIYPTNIIIIRLPKNDEGRVYNHPTSIHRLIFSPDFMRSIWGEERVCDVCGKKILYWDEGAGFRRCPTDHPWTSNPAYTYHQMQAIKLSGEDYIKYLYDNLKGGGDGNTK